MAIIPARGGSVRIPRKNIKLFHGKPIIAYAIEIARRSGLFDGIYVSTEDDEIRRVAESFGALHIERPLELAEVGVPDCGTQAVTRHALSLIPDADYACCIYATSPLLSVYDLRIAFNAVRSGNHPYAYGVHQWRGAGQFYFGCREAFMAGIPLDHWATKHIQVEHFCDINTMDDWVRAEKMYARLKKDAA